MTSASRAAFIATAAGTGLQVAMVCVGHTNPSVMKFFAVGGMGISLLAGLFYSLLAKPATQRDALLGGVAVGGICAFIGILVSHLLGDVPASLLLLGTISSCVTGAIGGSVGKLLAGNAAASAAR